MPLSCLTMDQSALGCFNINLSAQDAFAVADLGFERLNRKPNFNAKETKFIIDMVRKYRFVLNEKSLDSATNEKKREVWQLICDGINEMTPGVSRSVDEIRKRWQNLNCTARKEASKFKKYQNEGLPPPPLSNFSIQILGMTDSEDYGQEADSGQQSVKIEIDLASEDNDDNSIQDLTGFSGIPGSPVQPSGDSNKCDSLPGIPEQVYLTTPTSDQADDSHQQGSNESSNNNDQNTSSKNEISSQSNYSISNHRKFASNGSLPNTDRDNINGVNTSRSRGPNLSSGFPFKSSNTVSSQGAINQSKTSKSKPFNMTSDIQIISDCLLTTSTNQTTSTNKSGVTSRQQDSAKRRRLDDLSLQLHEDLITNEQESLILEREKLKLDREKIKMEQEQLGVERQKLLMEKEKLSLEKEVEREKLRMERERFSLEMQQDRQKIALERERLELAREQERARGRLEQERMEIEKEKMAMEQEKLALEISYWRRKLLQTRTNHDENVSS